MRAATELSERQAETPDYSALRLMLTYVEAECLRIGASDAARHAALAAAMMPPEDAPRVAPLAAPASASPPRPSGRHLH